MNAMLAKNGLIRPRWEVSSLFGELQTESKRVIDGIQGLSKEPLVSGDSSSSAEKNPAMDNLRISKILHTLKETPGAGDLEALSMARAGLATGIPVGYKSEFDKLYDLIGSYDFEEAAEIVDRLLEQFRVT